MSVDRSPCLTALSALAISACCTLAGCSSEPSDYDYMAGETTSDDASGSAPASTGGSSSSGSGGMAAAGANGGSATGGADPSTGGTASGGAASGGAASGGAGGTASGGTGTGGEGTGGAGTGGASSIGSCIMALGDSITQADKDHLGYRYRLWVDLTADGKPFGFVGSMTTHYSGTPTYPNASYDRDHEGHWGWRADELLRDLPTWLRGYTPDIVLMHVGSNDAFQSNSTDSTVSELKAIIAALRADNPSVVVLLAKLIPATDSGRNQRVNELNARIPGIVSELSTQASPLILVDQNSGFSANSDTYDGVHPNEAGEQKMANRWREALLPLLANARGCD